MEACINITPASTPVKLKNLTNKKPINGPTNTLTSEYVKASSKWNTFSLDKATPRDTKTRKMAEYPIKKVAFSRNLGAGILK